jgi:hypothetical protein
LRIRVASRFEVNQKMPLSTLAILLFVALLALLLLAALWLTTFAFTTTDGG